MVTLVFFCAIKKNGIKIVHFIVSPTRTFSLDNWIDPLFVKYTMDEFDWIITKNDVITITSRTYDVTIYIFCTMMPTVDRNNTTIFNRLMQNQMTSHYATIIKQTESDINFVSDFYSKLNKLKWHIFINEKRSESLLVNEIKKKYEL